ncbi:alginate export family protein [Flavihumibacter solisilvae]|uniref:Alginate export domain-containing protein n=1 Tax=Flavihumibacter solisilvae TaxID=1349421 RepID=A0A0C1IUT4_9BACT|nr:alginate export family protein [Flavihumibacter solisilvae]KIC94259.1 hypothetical protein OI18_12870 [Flavihumibacter solisilvae]
MKFHSALIAIICLFCHAESYSQEEHFTISGQYRLRPEFRNGYRTLSSDTTTAAFFLAQRARLIFDYQKSGVASRISIQDSRTWGDEEGAKDLAGLQVNELWFEFALNRKLSVKLGRQELVYDDHRLLGNMEWGNVTRSHDAIVVKFTNREKQFQAHAGGAFNQSGEPLYGTSYPLKNYKALAFGWLKKEFGQQHSLSAIAILNGLNSTVASAPNLKASFTFGPLYNYNGHSWKTILGGYYQGGKTENNLKLLAFMLNAYAEKRINRIAAGLGLDYLSGSSDATKTGHSHSFSTLYATNHKFYGQMDYFLNIPADTKQRGLADAYLRLTVYPSSRLTVNADLHHFSFAHETNSEFQSVGKPAGTETDFTMEYKPSTIINLQAGYAMLFATENMESVKGGDYNNYNGWAFIMLKISPVFFKHVFKSPN